MRAHQSGARAANRAPGDDVDAASVWSDDEAQFAALVARYEPQVVRLALRMTGDPSDAQDIAQDTFLRAYKGRHTLARGRSVRTWLMRIARNAAIDVLRHKRRTEELSDEHSVNVDLGPDALAIQREEARALYEVLGNMPRHYRAVLELRYVHDQRYRDIAATLNLPMGTVKTHLRRALQRLGQEAADRLLLVG